MERVVLCVLDLSEIRGSTDLFQDCLLFFSPLVRDKEPILWKNRFLYNKSPIGCFVKVMELGQGSSFEVIFIMH